MSLNLSNCRNDFRIFDQSAENAAYRDLIYFDNAATTQRPECVISAMADFYRFSNANPLRGLYSLSIKATDMYEAARHTVASFLHAAEDSEIIFTRNASESLNLVAYSWGMSNVQAGDEIVVSCMEHHSNLLPWQMVARAKRASLVFLECGDDGV
ncbi:MAG: aminotransferase class V-fold PLP-dependent enzyme, partial [Treponema sp.]|nr:aminotransferase class V-fold PLP-dependent enzyme [Treponema sp.]